MNTTHATLKIAVPIADGLLCMHFGHCGQIAILTVDTSAKAVVSREDLAPPPHEPGVLPAWLGKLGVNAVFAGGMGQRAMALFQQQGIDVRVGLPAETPEQLVARFFEGTLESGENVCDH
ncbi:MAG: NifB/NifX family molybdenum-iron cluster-binding protein [Kiritimatiellia bacterium]|jgi:ATP-binding protein involved in chromosome partitioning